MTDLPSTLDAVVAAENAGYAALVALLHDETRALCAGDIGVLERQSAAKLEHVRNLERLFAERKRLAAHRPPADAATRPPADAATTAAQDFDAALRLLHERAAEAQRVNALNGRLIDRHQLYASRSLAALRDAAGQPALYGADGQSARAPGAQPRATA